jgi:hypothetical protein
VLNPRKNLLNPLQAFIRFHQLGWRPIVDEWQRRRQPMGGFVFIAEYSHSVGHDWDDPSDL